MVAEIKEGIPDGPRSRLPNDDNARAAGLMFRPSERIRQRPSARGWINFFSYLHLALWNHVVGRVPLYWLRHLVIQNLFGMRMGSSNLHRAVFLLSPWNMRVGDNVNIQMGCLLDSRGANTRSATTST